MKLILQYILPHHLLTRIVGAAADSAFRPLARAIIRGFCRLYQPDMNQAAEPDPDAYPSFNAFFTRALKDESRPMPEDAAAVASPVDGVISQIGRLEDGSILQAKGRHYAAADLLGEAAVAGRFAGGKFATIYLSPRHYHRVHMPLAGALIETRYIPGRLFSVAPFTARGIPGLFCRNERLVCRFATDTGEMALVLVGAMLVAGTETIWHGRYGHARHGYSQSFNPRQVTLARGEEMGRFNMGSTVIVMFEPGRVDWHPAWEAGANVRLGQSLGTPVTGA